MAPTLLKCREISCSNTIVVPTQLHGRPREFCSPACRVRTHRAEVREAKRIRETTCALKECMNPRPERGRTGRPPEFCSPHCRERAAYLRTRMPVSV